jgi:hypothetical protein
MSGKPPERPNVKKRAYTKPALKIYGQVRELTGASVGSAMGDAGSKMLP